MGDAARAKAPRDPAESLGLADWGGVAGSMRALAHPIRVRMVVLLRGEALSASDLARRLGFRSGSARFHLHKLVEAGIADPAGNGSTRRASVAVPRARRSADRHRPRRARRADSRDAPEPRRGTGPQAGPGRRRPAPGRHDARRLSLREIAIRGAATARRPKPSWRGVGSSCWLSTGEARPTTGRRAHDDRPVLFRTARTEETNHDSLRGATCWSLNRAVPAVVAARGRSRSSVTASP